MKKFFNAMSDRTSRDLDRISSKGLTRLQQAADDNDVERIKLLLRRKADINETGLCGETALHRAIRQSNYSAARALIEAGADIDLPDANGQTPLHHATITGNSGIFNLLLNMGAEVSAVDHEGRTPMHMVQNNHEDMLTALATRGGDVNAADKNGYPPLNYHLRNAKLVRALLQLGADPNFSTTQASPIVTAVSLDLHVTHPSVVQLLLSHGANPDARSLTTHEPLLHLAARNGHSMMIIELLARKADITATDAAGHTLAHALTQLPQPDSLRMALQRAPELAKATARTGKTPLHIVLDHLAQTPARGTETHIATLMQLARLLIEHGADPSTASPAGTTLLHEATTRNLTDMVAFLAAKKANLNARDAQDQAPLHLAITARNIDLLDLLLDAGADPDLTDARGWTVLDRLAEKKDRESPTVQRLIVAGGQYNKQLPLYPDQIRPRGGAAAQGSSKAAMPPAANDASPFAPRKITPAIDQSPRDSIISPVKKITKRQPPTQG